jgi:Cu2+-exporting ATPase
MKTSVINVHDMLSVLSVEGVEERIGEVPGVESVTVNFAAGNATVRFDETRLELADIKADVRQRGSEADAQSKAPTPDGHKGHAAPASAKGETPDPVAPKTPSPDPATGAEGDADPAAAPADKLAEPVKAP